MNLFEYEGKQQLRRFSIPTPDSVLLTTDDAPAPMPFPFVLKAQVMTGGRGKAGGVKVCQNEAEYREYAKNILHMQIKGHSVHGLLAEQMIQAEKEYYISITQQGVELPTLIFSRMGGMGPLFGILFYLLVVFAAISSSISLLEVIVAHFVDKARDAGKGDKRKVYTLIAAAAVSLGCILVCADALGNSNFSPADLLGIAEPKAWAADWLDFWDAVSEGVMMPLGALLMTFMVAYEIGTGVVKDEIEQCGNKFTAFKFYNVCVRYVAPLGLLLVLYGQIKQFFF